MSEIQQNPNQRKIGVYKEDKESREAIWETDGSIIEQNSESKNSLQWQ